MGRIPKSVLAIALLAGCTAIQNLGSSEQDSAIALDAWPQIDSSTAGSDAADPPDARIAPVTIDSSTADAAVDASLAACTLPRRFCGGACVTCPSDANAAATQCDSGTCVLSRCWPGYTLVANRCVADATPGSWQIRRDRGLTTRPPSNQSGRRFGASMALSHDGLTLAVGDADHGAPVGDGYEVPTAGAVHVYERQNLDEGFFDAPPTQTILVPRLGDLGKHSVGVSGNGLTLVIANNSSPRDVHVFSRANRSTSFALSHSVATDSVDVLGYYGTRASVAISANGLSLAIGTTYGSRNETGVVYTYERSREEDRFGPNYTQRIDGQASFGTSLEIAQDGRTLLVMNFGYLSYGDFHLFERTSVQARWEQTISFVSLPGNNPREDATLAANGLTFVVGGDARLYFYSRAAGLDFDRQPQAVLAAPDGNVGFGAALAMRADLRELYVADDAYLGSGAGTGAIYVFVR